MTPIDTAALGQLFHDARSVQGFKDEPVPEETLHKLYETMKFAPTSMNCQPARYVFLTTDEAKRRLEPALAEGNREKAMKAPVVTIIAYDTRFYEYLPTQFSAYDAKPMFERNETLAHDTAFRNGSMQGGYFILAARALGLACGPMSGFNADRVNADFFPDGRYRVNFLCSLGVGDPEAVHPRGPRLAFDEVARIL